MSTPDSEPGDTGTVLVSIIIPAYNYGRFLVAAVDSALAQTYPNCEVIVVNDGSTDSTGEVAERYGDRIVYCMQENQGLSAARNTGIRLAKGAYLVFLDADDVLRPEMVAVSLEAMEKLGPKFAVVGHIEDRIDGDGKPLRFTKRYREEDVEVSFMDMVIQNRFPVTAMVRSDAFEKVGLFDTELPACEDRDMWIRIAREFRLYRLHAPLSLVRKHGDNMTRNLVRQVASIRMVHRKVWKNGDLSGWRVILWLKVLSFFHYQKAQIQGEPSPGRALLDLALSLLLWPVFPEWKDLGQPWLFRPRLGFWILRGCP